MAISLLESPALRSRAPPGAVSGGQGGSWRRAGGKALRLWRTSL